ncbi:MAG: hypothetical protein HKN39_05575 [Flavobacteriales bacterium]|nr:hypothetical protein [Flavobacteriales bacterium]
MGNLLNDDDVMALAEGEADDRSHLDATAVRKLTQHVLNDVERLLERAYNLTYLEAKLHCDAYHEGKNSFSDLGESYGYINSFVRRDGGTNCMRFAYRRPTGNGHLIRENIRMPSQGYTAASFKRSAHDYEKELAVMTEEHYSRLRNQGKTLKSVARKIRNVEIFNNGDANETN